MKLFFNKLDEYVLIIDRFGKIKFCNDKLLSYLEYKENDICERSIYDLLVDKKNLDIEMLKNKENIDISLYSSSNKIIPINCEIVQDVYNNESVTFIIGKDIFEKYYSKEDLEVLLDKSPLVYWIKDIDGKYLYVNKAYEVIANESKINILGKIDEEMWGIENAIEYRKIDKYVLDNNKSNICEQKIIHNNKEEWFEKFKYPVRNKDGKLKYILGYAKNITADKNLKSKIKDNYTEMASLNSLINNNEKVDLSELLNNICKNIMEFTGAKSISMLLYDKEKNRLEPNVISNYVDMSALNNGVINISNDEVRKILNDISYDGIKSIEDVYCNKGIKSSLKDEAEYVGTYTISLNNEFIGLLCFSYEKGYKPHYNTDESIKIICKQLAVIIKNYKLYNEVKLEFKKRIDVERKLELFLKTSADISAIVARNGELKKVDGLWEEIVGWSEEELLSMKWTDIIHPEDAIRATEAYINRCDNSVLRFKSRYLCKNGEYKWIHANIMQTEEDNEEIYILTGRDITLEKKIEDEKKALQEAVEIESIKNEFFANISHEFKTPLNIILGTMQLLNKKVEKGSIYYNEDANLLKYIGSIKQNSYRLLRLVNNLIDMTKIDTGYYEIYLKNYDIVKIVEDITMSVTQYVEDKRIDIIFDTNVEESVVACDPDKIERIMLNILSNAIKYTDKYGKITVNLNEIDEKIIVSIKDNGVGISEEKLDFIFERFVQANNALTRKCEGSGIGLSLVKSLVNMHDGEIYVNSKVGKGTEFIFEIPIRTVETENKVEHTNDYQEFRIEKCNVEFSDIYS